MRVLMCSDDPDTILSYGLLSRMIIDEIYKDYELHYLSLQYPLGKPIYQRDEKGVLKYIKYPAHNQGERNPTHLPEVLRKTKPEIFWTNFDIQHYLNVEKYVPPNQLWVGWCPWDNHDSGQIPRAQAAFKKVDVRIAISKFGFEFLNSNKVRMDDFNYNIVDTNIFKPLQANDPSIIEYVKKNPVLAERPKILLFVGRPNWRKRVIHMLRIVQELKRRGHKFYFFFHSNVHDPARTVDIDELIHALGIQDRVIRSTFHWDQGIPKEELNVLYNLATLYIAPHGGEGFGMPIVEGMAAGLPFIASDYTTTREFAGQNQERGFMGPIEYIKEPDGRPRYDKGVIRPYPIVDKFADIIEQVWEDEKRLKKMGENGTKWAKQNCSLKPVITKWKNIFNTFNIPLGKIEGYK